MSQSFQHLGAVVFDWAGTTVDHGSRAPALVFREIFLQQGIEISFSQARGPMGLAKRDHIAAILKLPEVAEQWQQRFGHASSESDIDRLYDDFLPLQKETLATHSDVITGVPGVVDECRRRGLRIGSTTGYTHELIDVFSESVAARGYAPDCVVCADDTRAGRPAPWMLFEAAHQLGVFPMWRVVKVDDTPPGIEAGCHAGCWTVGVTRTGNEVGLSVDEISSCGQEERDELIAAASSRLMSAGAHFLVESVADLLPVLREIEDRLKNGKRPGPR